MKIINYEIKEKYIIIFSILFLIFVNIFMRNKNEEIEEFAYNGHHNRKYYKNFNYRYIDWYDRYYWLYYINPFYPPRQVYLPFEGRDGGVSWYEPWNGKIFNN